MAVSAGELDSDRALVLAVQRGDLDAYSELFRRHYATVRAACARRLLDAVEADEVAQAAFVRAFERIDQCTGDRRFGPWVHVIARYLCVDSLRAKARVVPRESPVADDVSGGGQPEDSMLDLERSNHMRQALESLPERQRHAVIARTFEGRRPVEIAASLGLSVAAVDSLLLRARRGLAVAYARVAGEGGAAAATTSTSAAASLGGTIAVGPGRVVDGVVAAGHAVGGAAGDIAVKAAAFPPVRGIGAGVASAVMSVTMAVTGATAPPPSERPAVVVTTTIPASVLPVLPNSADVAPRQGFDVVDGAAGGIGSTSGSSSSGASDVAGQSGDSAPRLPAEAQSGQTAVAANGSSDGPRPSGPQLPTGRGVVTPPASQITGTVKETVNNAVGGLITGPVPTSVPTKASPKRSTPPPSKPPGITGAVDRLLP